MPKDAMGNLMASSETCFGSCWSQIAENRSFILLCSCLLPSNILGFLIKLLGRLSCFSAWFSLVQICVSLISELLAQKTTLIHGLCIISCINSIIILFYFCLEFGSVIGFICCCISRTPFLVYCLNTDSPNSINEIQKGTGDPKIGINGNRTIMDPQFPLVHSV
jgi:hypothetical protein